MEYIKLSTTGQLLSRIGLGGLAFGGHYGPVEKIDVIRTVHAAIDLGVTYFDTSPTYGEGRGEELLGEALGAHVDRVFIATRIGTGHSSELGTWRSNDRASIVNRTETSLRRLRREAIDLLMIYGPDPHTPALETMEALHELRAAGKIRFIGTCDTEAGRVRDYLRHGRLQVVQAPYNMLNRSAESGLIPFVRAAGLALNVCEPFLAGLLHGEMHRNSTFDASDARVLDPRFRGARFRRNVETVNRLRRVAEQERLTLTGLALGWVLQNPAAGVVLCGAKNARQIREIVRASAVQLTPEQVLTIEETIGARMNEQPA